MIQVVENLFDTPNIRKLHLVTEQDIGEVFYFAKSFTVDNPYLTYGKCFKQVVVLDFGSNRLRSECKEQNIPVVSANSLQAVDDDTLYLIYLYKTDSTISVNNFIDNHPKAYLLINRNLSKYLHKTVFYNSGKGYQIDGRTLFPVLTYQSLECFYSLANKFTTKANKRNSFITLALIVSVLISCSVSLFLMISGVFGIAGSVTIAGLLVALAFVYLYVFETCWVHSDFMTKNYGLNSLAKLHSYTVTFLRMHWESYIEYNKYKDEFYDLKALQEFQAKDNLEFSKDGIKKYYLSLAKQQENKIHKAKVLNLAVFFSAVILCAVFSGVTTWQTVNSVEPWGVVACMLFTAIAGFSLPAFNTNGYNTIALYVDVPPTKKLKHFCKKYDKFRTYYLSLNEVDTCQKDKLSKFLGENA